MDSEKTFVFNTRIYGDFGLTKKKCISVRISQIFDEPKLYEFFQSIVSKQGTLATIKDEIIRPDSVIRVLDFGCGIGIHSKLFTTSEYLGIEPLEACVAVAKQKYANSRVEFKIGNHLNLKTLPASSFDLVIAIGVLHHINSEIFGEFVKEANRILKPGARLTTFDPVLHKEQSKVSEWVVKQDRGAWVRTEREYLEIMQKNFSGIISTKIYSKLLRIPYDHIAMNAVKS